MPITSPPPKSCFLTVEKGKAITDLKDKRSESVESTPLNSGYVQVDRIVDDNSNEELSDDYLKVHKTGVEISDTEVSWF